MSFSVPSLLLAVHLGEQVDLDGAQRGCQDVKTSLQYVAEGGAHADRRAHQVGHRLTHHTHPLQEVQGALLAQGLALMEVAVGRRGLLDMVDEISRTVGEVAGGAAQWEHGQVQVTSRFGESMEEQPQLKHRVAWR